MKKHIANTITGFRILCSVIMLFLFPLTLHFIEIKHSAVVACSIATFSVIQEGYYIGTGREIV